MLTQNTRPILQASFSRAFEAGSIEVVLSRVGDGNDTLGEATAWRLYAVQISITDKWASGEALKTWYDTEPFQCAPFPEAPAAALAQEDSSKATKGKARSKR